MSAYCEYTQKPRPDRLERQLPKFFGIVFPGFLAAPLRADYAKKTWQQARESRTDISGISLRIGRRKTKKKRKKRQKIRTSRVDRSCCPSRMTFFATTEATAIFRAKTTHCETGGEGNFFLLCKIRGIDRSGAKSLQERFCSLLSRVILFKL
jgi:hypothetical protein